MQPGRHLLLQLLLYLSIISLSRNETYSVEFCDAVKIRLNVFGENIVVLCIVFLDA